MGTDLFIGARWPAARSKLSLQFCLTVINKPGAACELAAIYCGSYERSLTFS